MARPRKELSSINLNGWEALEALVLWSNAEYCAEQLRISVDTLDRRLRERYGYGYAEYKNKKREPIRINLLKKQYDVAMSGNVSMLIWLGKNILGQSDQTNHVLNIDSFEFVGDEDE